MFDLIAGVLAWFYSLVNDYAIAIVLLTMLIMLAFTPLTIKGTRSMMQMQEIQPEIKKLQARHKDDRQKLNEEMMKLYQSRGVNPLGGCLPSLVQLPVFFVLYRVINGLTRTQDDGTPNPDHLDDTSELYQDIITDGGEMVSFGIDLSRSANEVLKDNFVDALPYLLLVAFTFFLSWYQQRQMRSRRGDAVAANPQMEMMMKILPFMLPVFAFIVQAALAVYFITSSLYRIGQQAFIHATMKPPAASAGDSIIDVDPEPDPEPERPVKEVENKRSKKAIAAQEARDKARAERSAQRQGGAGRSRPPKGQRNGGQSNGKAKPGKGDDDGVAPIQSRRTSGDGRTRKRRK
ncbi:MAG: YidC/Oxa1 family membrane protein insertase [Actinomycetota bacterium]|jgi:YidC/Oxa1 family membrane protein insertase|nr:YidC/Oxa1 family membrane protein insertase [Actinomycetota bacterium]